MRPIPNGQAARRKPRPLLAAAAAVAVIAAIGTAMCLPRFAHADAAQPTTPPPPDVLEVPAGDYSLDKAHSSLNFRVSHMGFSRFTARFTRLDAKLNFDPDHPTRSSVSVDIDPASIQTNYPDPSYDFDGQLRGPDLLDTRAFPHMTWRSTRVELTGRDTARITGDLTLHGVTRPVVLEAKFNGGYGHHPMDPGGARLGFSAHGALKRSDFGISMGVPAPGSSFGVGDEVEVLIECEFTSKAAH
jgi:polyisoprenoid-binding protein YceI